VPDEQDGGHGSPNVEENVPFDRYQLDDTLQEIGGYLTELRHIDLVLDYVADRPPEERNPLHLPAPPNAIDEFGIRLGTTFPFYLSFVLYDVDESHVEFHVTHSLADEAAGWSANRMMELYGLVRPIAFPLVSGHDSLIDEIQSVQSGLDVVHTDFGGLANNLNDWKGYAAENFADSFYLPFEDCLRSQREFADALQGALLVSKEVIVSSQQSLMNAVSNAHAALRDQLQRRSQASNAPSLKAFLSVGSTITGIVSLVLTPVPGASIALAAASSGMAVVSHVLPDEATVLEIEGVSAADLAESTSVAINEIKHFVDNAYTELYTELNAVQRDMDARRDEGVLLPGRPDIADGSSGSEFFHVSSSRYSG
jgi:hypothetical protein